MCKIQYITSFFDMNLNVFLVVKNNQAYLLNFERDDFGYMCPCCMHQVHREAIIAAVDDAYKTGTFSGKVIWCCHKNNADHGYAINGFSRVGVAFTGDAMMAERLTPRCKELLREEIFRLEKEDLIKDPSPRIFP